MPASLNRDWSNQDTEKSANFPRAKAQFEFRESAAQCIDIGLINNMPDGALHSTERQFLTLLDSAAEGVLVRLWLYALPDVPRGELARRHIGNSYSRIENLWNRHLDGLIVTGTEPRSSNLMDEPYWASMTRVVEWAKHNTHSTIWSCLAAHAALLHLDGIPRNRLSEKCFGTFDCVRASDHHLTASLPSRLVMPHSRWHDLPENKLEACGYSVLTRTEGAGVDTFVKQQKSLFVFFQGHPEYEANTLLLEYARAIGRFLRQECDTYPAMPKDYFDANTASALTALEQRAVCDRRIDLLANFPMVLAERKLVNTWRPSATSFYRNWLTHLSALKERRSSHRRIRRAG